jgi:hypothetical protein
MALKKCKECKKEVSSSAKTCPHCGISNPTTTAGEMVIGFLFVVGMTWAAIHYFGSSSSSDDKAPAAEAPKKVSDAECQKDIQCWMERKLPEASYPCQKAVEKLAKYSAKWTDSTFEFKFDHMRWADQSRGVITYIGDKIQFQNGFGAYQNSIYECTYDPGSKTVINAEARPGKLD